MSIQTQLQNITAEITKQIESEILAKLKSILDRNFPHIGVEEMTVFELHALMLDNNLVPEIETESETISGGEPNNIYLRNFKTTVRVFRKEELK